MSLPKPHPLEPSELGTKEYWQKTYTHDIRTHAQTPSHTGQDWFSDVNASSKILRHLFSPALQLDKETTSFLDLGTGNGEMLFLLREEGGFGGRMVGVDYEEMAVEFCRRRMGGLGREEGEGEGKGEEVKRKGGLRDVEFEVWDVLEDEPRKEWKGGFDVVLDKGTFDAISLSGGEGRKACEGYREKVEPLVKEGGWFVVTSCNWTEEELGVWFGGGRLVVRGRVEYPVFRFGGGTGQSISTVCFRKETQSS